MSLIEKLGVRTNSIGALEKTFFHEGPKAAFELFSRLHSRPIEENYYVHLRPDNGNKVIRTDAPNEVKSVEYTEFDPPSFWQNRHQIMRVEVKQPQPDIFYYHEGEELVVPIAGPGVRYDFFWAETGNKESPRVYPSPKEKPLLVKEGSAIRIQPQIPHRAWGAGNEVTHAWMITRPLANTAAQIYVAWSDRVQNQANSRKISESELIDYVKNKPGQYALIAWGISEEIRYKRQRSNKSVAEVAERCDIDPAHLSKIEKGQTNVSLETLFKVFQFLDIDIAQLIAPPREAQSIVSLVRESKEAKMPLFKKPAPRFQLAVDPISPKFVDHYIHPQVWRLSRNSAPLSEPIKSEWASTWIMISGRAVFDLEAPENDLEAENKPLLRWKEESELLSRWKGASEVLDKESVLHLRGGGPIIKNILPLEDSVMLQIIFDPLECFCA